MIRNAVDRVELLRLPGPPALEAEISAEDRVRGQGVGPEKLGDVRPVPLENAVPVPVFHVYSGTVLDVRRRIEQLDGIVEVPVSVEPGQGVGNIGRPAVVRPGLPDLDRRRTIPAPRVLEIPVPEVAGVLIDEIVPVRREVFDDVSGLAVDAPSFDGEALAERARVPHEELIRVRWIDAGQHPLVLLVGADRLRDESARGEVEVRVPAEQADGRRRARDRLVVEVVVAGEVRVSLVVRALVDLVRNADPGLELLGPGNREGIPVGTGGGGRAGGAGRDCDGVRYGEITPHENERPAGGDVCIAVDENAQVHRQAAPGHLVLRENPVRPGLRDLRGLSGAVTSAVAGSHGAAEAARRDRDRSPAIRDPGELFLVGAVEPAEKHVRVGGADNEDHFAARLEPVVEG